MFLLESIQADISSSTLAFSYSYPDMIHNQNFKLFSHAVENNRTVNSTHPIWTSSSSAAPFLDSDELFATPW